MKFIHYLEKISGVSIYALTSLILFGLVFLAMTIWAFKADKKMIEELKRLPLDGAVKTLLLLGVFILPALGARAEGPTPPEETGTAFVSVMLIIIAVLGLAIALLAYVLLGAAQMSFSPGATNPQSDDAPLSPTYFGIARSGSANMHVRIPATSVSAPTAGPATPIPVAPISAPPIPAIPAPTDTPVHSPSDAATSSSFTPAPPHKGSSGPLLSLLPLAVFTGVSDTTFYMLTSVIILEVIILLTLLYNVWLILALHKKTKTKTANAAIPAKPRISWWDKMNSFRPLDQETALDLGHDYDGIRELDNRLPPWWLYGFYCTIIFAGIYLWRYHVAHSAPLSHEELQIALQKADVEKAAYLKKAANNVDETTVKQLTDPAGLAAGKAVFESTCFACHGKEGQGGVGPNLTDEYWLHGGSIQEIFKTIKYGWPDKGMKSWKDDFSPSKIAEIASYVKSLQGTHPANPKAPQGTLYK